MKEKKRARTVISARLEAETIIEPVGRFSTCGNIGDRPIGVTRLQS